MLSVGKETERCTETPCLDAQTKQFCTILFFEAIDYDGLECLTTCRWAVLPALPVPCQNKLRTRVSSAFRSEEVEAQVLRSPELKLEHVVRSCPRFHHLHHLDCLVPVPRACPFRSSWVRLKHAETKPLAMSADLLQHDCFQKSL